jgi:hypothetical protein
MPSALTLPLLTDPYCKASTQLYTRVRGASSAGCLAHGYNMSSGDIQTHDLLLMSPGPLLTS